MKMTTCLRNMISKEQALIIAPGVFDGLSALLAKQAGFPVLYASGGAIARSAGYPDIGLLTLTEVCVRLDDIVQLSQVPVIADADTGFGNAINVRRTVQMYERLGLAALHIEDQTFPKRCGHLNDKSIISTEDMCHKVRVAKESLVDPDFVIIARTDAIAVEGIDSAIARSRAYLDAGADVIFVEAPETEAQIEKIAAEIPEPKLINMFSGGKTPMVSREKLHALGYKIMIVPSDLQRAAIKAMQNTLKELYQSGNSAKIADQLTSFQEREVIVDTKKYFDIDKIKR
ncbi:MAG: oxaloacetate decarboxylase [Legionellaceae bacterium]|nr:oxaloacetate decarboxylase [Legionellaceae bacterium]